MSETQSGKIASNLTLVKPFGWQILWRSLLPSSSFRFGCSYTSGLVRCTRCYGRARPLPRILCC